MKRVAHLKNGPCEVNVYFSRAYDEWVVKLHINGIYQPEADYFTNDQEDALGTANAMLAIPL